MGEEKEKGQRGGPNPSTSEKRELPANFKEVKLLSAEKKKGNSNKEIEGRPAYFVVTAP